MGIGQRLFALVEEAKARSRFFRYESSLAELCWTERLFPEGVAKGSRWSLGVSG